MRYRGAKTGWGPWKKSDDAMVRKTLGDLWMAVTGSYPEAGVVLWHDIEMATGPGQTELVLEMMRRDPKNCAGYWVVAPHDPFKL